MMPYPAALKTTSDHPSDPGAGAGRANLRDLTIAIPVRCESDQRRRNLEIVVRYLLRWFDVRILVAEDGSQDAPHLLRGLDVTCFAYHDGGDLLHRTRLLNRLVRAASTRLVAIYDADVLLPPAQMIAAVRMLRHEGCHGVLPYDGRSFDIPEHLHEGIARSLSVDMLDPASLPCMNTYAVGGVVLWRRAAYIEGGMENERFVSWGPEDRERCVRFQRLGYRIERTDGPLFHLTHLRTPNSGFDNPRYDDNDREWRRIERMSAAELRSEVAGWPWVKA